MITHKPNIFLLHRCSNRVASARFVRNVLYRLHRSGAIELTEYPFTRNESSETLYPIQKTRLVRSLVSARPDILILGHLSYPWAVELASLAGLLKIRTVTVLADLNPPTTLPVSDACIVPSHYLKDRLEKRFPNGFVYVLPDIIERSTLGKPMDRITDELVLGWMGHEDNFYQVDMLKSWLRHSGTSVPLISISNHRRATVQWHADTWHHELKRATVGVLPVPETPWNWCKSENRLTAMLALGLPVVASPVPSYHRLAQEFSAVKIAYTPDQFISAVRELGDPQIRKTVIRGVPEQIENRFGVKAVAGQWLEVLYEIGKLPIRNKSKQLIQFETNRIKKKLLSRTV
jgi:hypothetical protein